MCKHMTRDERAAAMTQEQSPDDCWQGKPGDWFPPSWVKDSTVTCCDEGATGEREEAS